MKKSEKTVPRKRLGKLFIENFSLIYELALSLRSSLDRVKKLSPITIKKLEDMTVEEQEQIELFIGRFSKLQDLVGSKIFRNILSLDKEEVEAMRDVVNKMEKKYIVDNADEWDIIRDVRNEIIHQYIPKGPKAAKTIKKVFKYTPNLLEVLCNVHKYADEEIRLDMSAFDIKKLKIVKKKSTKKSK